MRFDPSLNQRKTLVLPIQTLFPTFRGDSPEVLGFRLTTVFWPSLYNSVPVVIAETSEMREGGQVQ